MIIKKNDRKMIFCEFCTYKLIVEPNATINLVEIKTSNIPGGIPELDEKTGKMKIKTMKSQNKKYKCPKCGRGVILKDIKGAYKKTFSSIEARKEKEKIEEDLKKRLEDGKPHEKPDLGMYE